MVLGQFLCGRVSCCNMKVVSLSLTKATFFFDRYCMRVDNGKVVGSSLTRTTSFFFFATKMIMLLHCCFMNILICCEEIIGTMNIK